MTNPLNGEILAHIGGADRRLRLGASELVGLQEFLGKGPVALARSEILDYREAAAIIHYGLNGAGANYTWKQTLDLINGIKTLDLITIAGDALLVALGHKLKDRTSKNGEEPGNPPKP